MFNRIWLQDAGEQKLSLNVKRNIAMLVRTQRKVGMLTLAEKALIRTHHVLRTVEERKKLVKLISNLVCFSKMRPKVRARLVSVVKFLMLGPGRTILKEGNEAVTAYYILTGEVELSKKIFDYVRQDYVDRVISIAGPGDCVGDVELLEGIPRLYTCTSTSECELLVVFQDDFNEVLRPELEKQLNEKKTALRSLSYFDFLGKDQIVAACKFGILHQFAPLEIIYFQDKGNLSSTYFVLSGECMILQCLKIKTTIKKGVKTCQLSDVTEMLKEEAFANERKRSTIGRSPFEKEIDAAVEAETAGSYEEAKKKSLANKMDIKSVEIACGLRKRSGETLIDVKEEEETKEIHSLTASDDIYDDISYCLPEYDEDYGEEDLSEYPEISTMSSRMAQLMKRDIKIARRKMKRSTTRISKMSQQNESADNTPQESSNETGEEEELKTRKSILRTSASRSSQPRTSATTSLRTSQKISPRVSTKSERSRREKKGVEEYDESSSESTSEEPRLTFDLNDSYFIDLDKKKEDEAHVTFEDRFIDVGTFSFGAVFGLGESMEHRVIMARTTVQCLILPRFWLFERDQNPGNVWQRRRLFLETTLPSRTELFENLQAAQKWRSFKKHLMKEMVNPAALTHTASVKDIPIILRLIEIGDDDDEKY